MTKERILGILRHVLTFVGGIVVAKGWLDDATFVELAGAVVSLVGALWSVFSKKPAETTTPTTTVAASL